MIISLILLDVISVGAAIWLISVVTLWEVASVLVVVRLWLFALLPWPGVGAFAGSAAHDFLHANGSFSRITHRWRMLATFTTSIADGYTSTAS